MKKLFLYIMAALFLCNMSFAYADDHDVFVQAVQKLAPGWKVESLVVGNITHTDKSYVAAILSKDGRNTVTLRIYMREPNNTLQLFIDAPNAICANCGGSAGDQIPYSLLMNNGGVLDINYEGGSGTGTTADSKWRYQNGGFYLIGMTQTIFDKMTDNHWTITWDANLSTLKMTEEHDLPNDNKTLTCAVPKKYQNVKLSSYTSDFLIDNMPKCSNADLPMDD